MNRPGTRSLGFSMVEVLVTLVILAFGVLGLINLQVKLQMNEAESYQRGQAVVLLEDMASRLRVVQIPALPAYATGASWLGVDGGDCTQYGDTSAPVADDPVERDVCAWSGLLQGAAVEQSGSGIGAMKDARGCVVQVQAGNTTDGSCQAAIYRVSVAWQGLYESAAPTETCAEGQYGDIDGAGDDGYRRVISTLVVVGAPQCL